MKQNFNRLISAGLACLLFVGCSGNATAPTATVSRFYVLASIDVKYLPVTLVSDSISTTEAESGNISLNDSLYTRSLVVRTTYAASLNKAPVTVTYTEFGVFTFGKTTVDFVPQGGNGLQFGWNREGALLSSTIAYGQGGHYYKYQIQ